MAVKYEVLQICSIRWSGWNCIFCFAELNKQLKAECKKKLPTVSAIGSF